MSFSANLPQLRLSAVQLGHLIMLSTEHDPAYLGGRIRINFGGRSCTAPEGGTITHVVVYDAWGHDQRGRDMIFEDDRLTRCNISVTAPGGRPGPPVAPLISDAITESGDGKFDRYFEDIKM